LLKKSHEAKEVALQCGTLEYVVHLILEDIVIETHVMYHDDKELIFKLTNKPMVGGTKLNLVLMDQMKYEHKLVVV
jgi:hypothetical protein